MSTQLPPRYGSSEGELPPRLGTTGGALPPRVGSSLDAPSLPAHDLTRATQFDAGQVTSQSLEQQAMGRASMILDQVRNRRMSWQNAQSILKTLSDQDKQTLTKFRPNMNEDERRALGMSKGGHGLLGKIGGALEEAAMMGPNLLGMAIGRDNPVTDTSGNLVSDASMAVRTAIPGIAKLGMAAEHDT